MAFHDGLTKRKSVRFIHWYIVKPHIFRNIGGSTRSACHVPMWQILTVDQAGVLVFGITQQHGEFIGRERFDDDRQTVRLAEAPYAEDSYHHAEQALNGGLESLREWETSLLNDGLWQGILIIVIW